MGVRLGFCLLAASVLLAGCTSSGSGSGEGGSTFGNLFRYGGLTAPPVAPTPGIEVADCPPVTVDNGRAALSVGGDTARSQISITNVARECAGRPDGAVVVKVGVEGRVLLGPGGAAGRFDAPVTIALKRGDQVLATRSRRVAVTVSPGQLDGGFVVVEEDLVAPAGTGEFDIEVGLGSGPRPGPVASRRKTRG